MKTLARLSVLWTILLYALPFGLVIWIIWKIYDLFKKFNKDPQGFVNQFPRIGALLGFVGYDFGGKGIQIPDVTGKAGVEASDKAQAAVAARGTQTYYNEVMRLAALAHGFTKTLDIQGTFVWPWRSYKEWDAQRSYAVGGAVSWPKLPYEDEYNESK